MNKPRYQVEHTGLTFRFQRFYAVTDTHTLDDEGRPIAVFQTDSAPSAEDRCYQANSVYARRARGRT
jgi:hypothetical protein